MPRQQQQQRRRRERRPNVFVQESSPAGREEIEEDLSDASGEVPQGAGAAVSTGRAKRVRAQRAARQARARSEIFTRSMGKELRKLGILTGGILVVLIVLAFVL